jgi:hypothetical protein
LILVECEMTSSLLECPICMQPSFSAMVSIVCGHSLCEQCSKRIKTCPTCLRKNVKYIPDYTLRHLVAERHNQDEKTSLPGLVGELYASNRQLFIDVGLCTEAFGIKVLQRLSQIPMHQLSDFHDIILEKLPAHTHYVRFLGPSRYSFHTSQITSDNHLFIRDSSTGHVVHLFNTSGFGRDTPTWKILDGVCQLLLPSSGTQTFVNHESF